MSHACHCNHSCTTNANHSYIKKCDDLKMQTDLSKRFQEIRIAAGDTPAQAAAKVGISRQGYNKWENGDTENIKLANLLRFCQKYDVAVEPLIRCAAVGLVYPLREYDSAQVATVHQLQEPAPARDELISLASTLTERECFMAIGAIRAALIGEKTGTVFEARTGQ